MTRMKNGECIVIDGGTGTEVERRGVPQLEHAWNGGGTLSHPEVVRTIHEDYIGHGAEIIISNTFAASRHALRDAGVEHLFERFNETGIRLALEARENMQKPDVLVAGGVAYWSWSGRHPTLDVLSKSIAEQVTIMEDSGADLIMLEMMVDIDRMLVTLEAAQTCNLPVWVGFSCEPDDQGTMRLFNGDAFVDALAAIKDKHVPLVSIMHTEVENVDGCLDVLDAHWDGLVGVYAHSSITKNGKWFYEGVISPDAYAAHSREWLKRNIHLIGGCCGIEPDHMERVRRLVTP